MVNLLVHWRRRLPCPIVVALKIEYTYTCKQTDKVDQECRQGIPITKR